MNISSSLGRRKRQPLALLTGVLAAAPQGMPAVTRDVDAAIEAFASLEGRPA